MIKSARDKIRPKENTMKITNFTAVVSTQSLLDNTAQRLLKLQEDVITTLMTSKNYQQLNISLICSWGCDGSSSQSIYNQKSTNDDRQDFDETHMFATTLTPLRMTAFVGKSKEFIIWNNSLPQSYRSCGPVNLMYKKETKELTLSEISRVRKDIESLSPYEESLGDGRKLIVTFSMHLTVIDGKVLAALTGVPCISCPLCGAKPNDFNEKENVGAQTFQPNPLSLRHGASPLHARIRFMELLFNVAIRMEVKVWRVCDDLDKVKVSERKKFLQEALQQTLNLRIDYPNPGGPGNSNNGNTARRFFEKYQETSKILGLDEDLIFRFRNILIALNCQMPLKAAEFGRYCVETNNKFIDLYGWYKIPSSVHKILIHSEEIIMSSVLPLVMLGEEGAESRNKYYRSDRVHHARKNSRENNLRDIFVRALETLDPLISSFSTCARRKLENSTPFSAEVVFFLQAPSSSPLSSPDSSQSSAISSSSDGVEDDSSVSLENEDLDCLVRRQEDMVTLIAEDSENVC